jgi:hypothetical protein
MKYKLPCSCGQTIPIEVSQAGQTVRCNCGADVEVPAMRLIRSLPIVEAVGSAKPSVDSPWPIVSSLLFAVGMLLFVGGLGVAGYYQWGRTNLFTEEVKWDNLEESHARIDSFTISEAWEGWTVLRDGSIGPYTPPVFVVHRFVSEYWLKHVLGSLIVAAVGLALVLSAFISRSATRGRGRPSRGGKPPVKRPASH